MSISRYVKIGAFFISLGTAGTGYMLMSTDGYNALNTRVYEVVMDDATGLSTNSKVFLSGVPVGKIKSIELDGENAILKVSFLKDVEIRGDANVSRRSSSILGTSMLVLNPGSENRSPLPVGSRIQPAPSGGDMGALFNTAQDLSVELVAMIRELQENQLVLLNSTLETVNSLARKVDDRSEAELDKVSRILEATAGLTEYLESLLASQDGGVRKSADDLGEILVNVRRLSADLQSGDGTLSRLVYEDELYASLLDTTRQAEAAIVELRSAVDGVSTFVKNTETVVKDAGTIVSQASGIHVQVDTNARYGFMSGLVDGSASMRLIPQKGDRWYRVGVNDDMKMDLELARRFGFLTLRGGLLEGGFGMGFDIEPVSWLSLSSEVLDFSAGTMPDLRAGLRVYPFFDPESDRPWHWLYVSGGMTRILDDTRSVYLGAGLRFADSEVRSLIGLVPYVVK